MEIFRSSLSRLTCWEQGGIRLFEGILGLREGVVLQVSRAAGDAAVGLCQTLCSPLSISTSLPESSQHIEALASSSSLPSHSELASETQGPEPNQDSSSAQALVSFSPLPGFAAFPSPLPSSQVVDDFVHSPEPLQQQPSTEGSERQGPEQTQDDSESGPVALKDELVYPELLGSEAKALLCEQGLCGGRRESLSLVGEETQGPEQTHAVSESVPAALEDELVYPEMLGSEGKVDGECVRVEAAESEPSLGSSEFERLDGGALLQILSRLDSKSLVVSSLVCRKWAEESCIARTSLTAQTSSHVVNLSTALCRFPRLQTLKILRAPTKVDLGLTDRHLMHIGLWASELRHLEIKGCDTFSDVGLGDVLELSRQLTVLSLTRCGGFEGKAFEGVRCKLTKVNLYECERVSNAGLIALGSACPRLQVFTLIMAKSAALAPGLEGLARRCGALRDLRLHACQITDASLSRLAASCPGLALASFSCEPAITDAGVAAFQHALRHLERLGLTDNEGLRRIPCSGSGLPLKSLSLGWWSTLPASGFLQLAEEKGLELLQIFDCPNLSDAAIAKILTGCSKLKRLVVANTSGVTSTILLLHANSGTKARLEIENCANIPASAFSEELRLQGSVSIV